MGQKISSQSPLSIRLRDKLETEKVWQDLLIWFEGEMRAEQQDKNQRSGTLHLEVKLVDLKLGDSQMSYIQYVVQEQNVELFEQIMATDEGQADFVSSKDLHGNSCFHYIALFDKEDFILAIFKVLGHSIEYSFKLKTLASQANKSGRLPLDFFMRGKADSYEHLQSYLSELQVGYIPSENIKLIMRQLKQTRTLRKSSSMARMPSQNQLQQNGGSSTSLNKQPSFDLLKQNQQQRSSQMSSKQFSSYQLAPIQEQLQETENVVGHQFQQQLRNAINEIDEEQQNHRHNQQVGSLLTTQSLQIDETQSENMARLSQSGRTSPGPSDTTVSTQLLLNKIKRRKDQQSLLGSQRKPVTLSSSTPTSMMSTHVRSITTTNRSPHQTMEKSLFDNRDDETDGNLESLL